MTGHGVRSEGHTAQHNANCGMRVTPASPFIEPFLRIKQVGKEEYGVHMLLRV